MWCFLLDPYAGSDRHFCLDRHINLCQSGSSKLLSNYTAACRPGISDRYSGGYPGQAFLEASIWPQVVETRVAGFNRQ